MSDPIDLQQRQRALDPTSSFICEAPAGSGKTELLTQRVLTLLARVDQPEAILAITFTRKAAAEMRERVLKALGSGRGPKPAAAHAQTTWTLAQNALNRDREKNWNLLQNPSRLSIRTFDSLCAFLNQTLPLQASMGINVTPAESPEELYERAVLDLLDSVERSVPWAYALVELLAHLDNNQTKLMGLLTSMLKARDSWMPVIQKSIAETDLRSRLQANLFDVVTEKSEHIKSLLSPPNISHDSLMGLFSLFGFAAQNIKRIKPSSDLCLLESFEHERAWPNVSEEGLQQWQAIRQILLTGSNKFRSRLDKNCGFPPGESKEEKPLFKQKKEEMKFLLEHLNGISGLQEALQEIAYWPALTYSKHQWPVLEHLLQLLPVALAHLRVVFAQTQQIDFVEMNERARQALGEEGAPSTLALKLDQRIEHILVDEFQDTSFGQVELLTRLTAGWQADDGRTLFCVGDAMQSIYGFRGAKVGLFLHCRQNGLGDIPLEPLQLRSNFRSQGKMVRWINTMFAAAFPSQSNIAEGAVSFAAAHDFNGDLEGEPVLAYLSDEQTDRALEIAKIREIIESTWQRDVHATIAVLVRNRNHAELAVEACRQMGLRFRAVDLIALGERPVIQDVMSLTKALLDPLDRVSWFAILRAPWCGLTLDDLLCLSPENDFSVKAPLIDSITELLSPSSAPRPLTLSDSGHRRLSRAFSILNIALHERERLPLAQWVEGVWISLGGAACLYDSADVENVKRFMSMLQQLTQHGDIPSHQQLDDALAKLFAAPDPQGDERLQIMTIHKSKGLEFDVVLLPELQRNPRSSTAELLIWSERVSRQGKDQWILAPVHAAGNEKDSIYAFVQQEQKHREHYEACRLLYVACTRAKKRMYLMARLRRDPESGDWNAPGQRSLLGYIWPSIKNQAISLAEVSNSRVVDNAETTESESSIPKLLRLPDDWQGSRIAESHLLDHYIAPFNYDNQTLPDSFWVAEQVNVPAVVGTFIHEILQRVVHQGLALWQERELEQLFPSWQSRLQALGLDTLAASESLTVVSHCLKTVLNDSQFHELLKNAKNIITECDLTSTISDKRLIVDLFCDMGNTRAIVVDYKTSQPILGQSLHSFFAQELKSYRDILRSYQTAILGLGYSDVKVQLYFVNIGAWLDVSSDLKSDVE